MIIVTGGAGFIGSNIIHALNARGERNILLVDNLRNGHKMQNIADLDIADYLDKEDFIKAIKDPLFAKTVTAVFHQGACSATTEWDGHYVMHNNYDYSKSLLHWSIMRNALFVYASSASVYGLGAQGFRVERACERPINMYAYSKFQFDQYVRCLSAEQCQAGIVGLRYFNVYGPREQHKGSMSSVAFHFNHQVQNNDCVRLFAGTQGIADGEQQRDFIYIDDVVRVNLWFLEHPEHSGIYNVGTGRAESFNSVAQSVLAWHGKGTIEYIAFPDHLKGVYQNYTQADISGLRAVGYDHDFLNVKSGVSHYLDWLNH